jgi:hypothetical protein
MLGDELGKLIEIIVVALITDEGNQWAREHGRGITQRHAHSDRADIHRKAPAAARIGFPGQIRAPLVMLPLTQQ